MLVELPSFTVRSIDPDDHEEEQNHDSASVENDCTPATNGHKASGIRLPVPAGYDQRERRMHGVLRVITRMPR